MYYMTVDELMALLPSVFTSNELLRAGLSNLTPEDINAILGRSEVFLDSLRYKGCFVEDYQSHAFPRKLGTGYVIEKNDERVQKALCCIFFDLLNSSKSTREERIRHCIKSISTGGVSESYGTLDEVKEVSENYVKYLGFCLFKGVI